MEKEKSNEMLNKYESDRFYAGAMYAKIQMADILCALAS